MLSAELNRRILKLAPKDYRVSDTAPATFKDLVSSPGLVVWSGASENTIYGSPLVNYAFRAWHDSLHKLLGAEFTLDGEIRVAREQARVIGGMYAEIVIAEVEAQAKHLELLGYFPVDQYAFICDYLKKRGLYV